MLLTWLLVLAIPAQGTAASTMAFCGPNHHGGGATQVQWVEPAEHTHRDSGATTAPGHHDVSAQADQASSASKGFAAFGKLSNPDTHKCGACASCCSIGAILNSVRAVPAPVYTPTVFSTMLPFVDTFAADGPDRPPSELFSLAGGFAACPDTRLLTGSCFSLGAHAAPEIRRL